MSWKNTLGSYPVYLPPNALLSEKLIQDAHALTLHGGVGLTMTDIRRDYWIPRLRCLTKKVNHGVLDVKGFSSLSKPTTRKSASGTHHRFNSFPSRGCGLCQSNFKQGQFQERNRKSLHPAVCRGVYQEFQVIHRKRGEAPKGVLW